MRYREQINSRKLGLQVFTAQLVYYDWWTAEYGWVRVDDKSDTFPVRLHDSVTLNRGVQHLTALDNRQHLGFLCDRKLSVSGTASPNLIHHW